MSFFIASLYAQELDSSALIISAIEKSLEYKVGELELESGNAKLVVPEGFQFLDKKQSIYVLSDLWGNPTDSSIIGMLVPANKGVLASDSWVFTISFDEMGYVKDDDAADIDYNQLLKDGQQEAKDANPERIKQGYPSLEFVGWASPPYYDKDKKILHWAKELKFGGDSLNTLNYNLRILGRKGIFMLNAVASLEQLQDVKANIDKVITSVTFNEGHKYSDFNPNVDKVAAWTIGGLVAGKILAKAGFFAILLKFWKVIALAIVGFGGAIWNKLSGKKKNEDPEASPPKENDDMQS